MLLDKELSDNLKLIPTTTYIMSIYVNGFNLRLSLLSTNVYFFENGTFLPLKSTLVTH